MPLEIPPSNLDAAKQLLADPNSDSYMVIGTCISSLLATRSAA